MLLISDSAREAAELAGIYVKRGLDAGLAQQVAVELMASDALGAHARDELGMSEVLAARPLQAAFASAAAFTVGAAAPLATAWLAPAGAVAWVVATATLGFLVLLGALSAWTGGAAIVRGIVRVTFSGALAMVLTAGVGHMSGVTA